MEYQHRQEVETFLKDHNIDIFLLSGLILQNRRYMKIPNDI